MAHDDTLTCSECGKSFTLSSEKRRQYPGWKPKLCLDCYGQPKTHIKRELNLTTAEVLERFSGGPDTGVFTDGSCERNPDGPGGWGVVKAIQNKPIAQKYGHAEITTNNRMELTALIEGLKTVAADERIDVYTDSMYCYNIATKWAASWKRNGWTRGKKREQVENLDLVKELHELTLMHPKATVRWIRGHDGSLGNEYADSLSTAYTREVV